MTTVDLYARISDDQSGVSIGTDNQIAALVKWCEQRGWTVGETFRDDSVSAVSGKHRPGFAALLERTVKRPVAVYALDRLARVSKDMEAVLALDLTVYSLTAGDLDLSTPDGRVFARVVTAFATGEGEKKAARQRLRNEADAAAGKPYWRRAPLGHTLKGKATADAALVVAACEDVVDGVALTTIAKRWQEQGVKTPQGAQVWAARSVRDVLLNPRLIGQFTYKGEVRTSSVIEPLVDESLWSAVVGILTDSGRGPGGGRLNSLLTGIALCGTCKDGTTVRKARGRFGDGVQPIYRCQKFGHNARRADEVEDLVVGIAAACLVHDRAIELLEEADTPERPALLAKVQELRERLAEWEAEAPHMKPAEYRRITAPLHEALDAANAALQAASQRQVFRGLVLPVSAPISDRMAAAGEARKRFEALPLERQRAVLQRVFSEIRLEPGVRGKRPLDYDSVYLASIFD